MLAFVVWVATVSCQLPQSFLSSCFERVDLQWLKMYEVILVIFSLEVAVLPISAVVLL